MMEHTTPSLSPCPNSIAWDSGTVAVQSVPRAGVVLGQAVPEPDTIEERLALVHHDGGLSLELAATFVQLERVLTPAHITLLDKVGVAFDRLTQL